MVWRKGWGSLLVASALSAGCGGKATQVKGAGGSNGTDASTGDGAATVNGSGGSNAGSGGTEDGVAAVSGGTPPLDLTTGGGGTPQCGSSSCLPYQLYTSVAFYFLIDVSASMACPLTTPNVDVPEDCSGEETRLDVVREAVLRFAENPESAGFHIGLGYFGQHEPGETSCDAADYSDPAVEIGVVPYNAMRIAASLAEAVPIGETPTDAALAGSCDYVRAWSGGSGNEQRHIVLITDGDPDAPDTSDCNPDPDLALAAASTCLESDPSVTTHVIALERASTDLGSLALAGGSEDAIVVSEDASELLEALNEIAARAVDPCSFALPPVPDGEFLDLSNLHVTTCDAAGAEVANALVVEQGDCAEAGSWYAEVAEGVTNLKACPRTCELLEEGASAYLETDCGLPKL